MSYTDLVNQPNNSPTLTNNTRMKETTYSDCGGGDWRNGGGSDGLYSGNGLKRRWREAQQQEENQGENHNDCMDAREKLLLLNFYWRAFLPLQVYC